MKKIIKRVTTAMLALLFVSGGVVGFQTVAPQKVAANTGQVCANPQVSAAKEVISDARRDQLGLTAFPDIQMGVKKNTDGSYQFLGTAALGGNDPTRPQWPVALNGTLDDPTKNSVTRLPDIKDAPSGFQWIGGGPTYRDPSSGQTLQMLHLERAVTNKPPMFYAELHLGVVDPVTSQTTYLGPIITPNLSFAQANSSALNNSIEMAAPTFVARDGYLYVYFNDFIANNSPSLYSINNLAVARAPIAEVMAGAANGQTTAWQKYHNGGWDSPAIGGASTDTMPGAIRPWSPGTAYNAELNSTMMVSPISRTQVVLQASVNGMDGWTEPTLLFNDPNHFNAYMTLVGTGDDPSVLGKTFHIYYLQWENPNQDWSNARMMRRTVTCQDATTPAVQPLVRYVKSGRHVVSSQLIDTNSALRQAGQYPEASGSWKAFMGKQPGTHAIYSCRAGASDHFISVHKHCEGATLMHLEGYLYDTPPAGKPSTALYRCFNPGLTDHFLSSATNCESSGMITEYIVGYAPTDSHLVLSRFVSGKDSQATTGKVDAGYAAQKQWLISSVGGADKTQLFNCKYSVPGGTDYFSSLNSACEGTTKVNNDGWLYKNPPAAPHTPIYRCYTTVTSYDHFLSSDSNCEGKPNTKMEFFMGYALLR